MKKLTLLFLIFNLWQSVQGQLSYFNILPDIGAIHQQSRFKSITCDSEYIYVLGDLITELDSNGNNKTLDLFMAKFDYQGNLISKKYIKDSSVIRLYSVNNQPLHKLNDSIYYHLIYSVENTNARYADCRMLKLNLKSQKVLENVKLPNPRPEGDGIISYTQTTIENGELVLVYQTQVASISYNYIYIFDLDLNLNKIWELPRFLDQFDTYRWIDRDEHGSFNLIGEGKEISGSIFTGRANNFLLRLDSTMKQIYKKDLILNGNYFIGSGQTFTIHKTKENKFIFCTNKTYPTISKNFTFPTGIKINSNFDSIYFITNLSEFDTIMNNAVYYTTYIANLPLKDEYIISSALLINNKKLNNNGVLFKINSNGDSILTKKFQPLSWDSTRAKWMLFNQVISTPYNSLIVAAHVSDASDNYVKGWLLHVDADGCLVPGCNDKVNTMDQKMEVKTAFKIYHNPNNPKMVYILSEVETSDNYELRLLDIQGHPIKSTTLRPYKGMQYILELEQSLQSGTYVVQILGHDTEVSEKIMIP